ncbi:MAG: phosphoenolpyruvate synthase [Myxococcota bacterium]
MTDKAFVLWFDKLDNDDVGLVGGKNASLGEMHKELGSKGIRVPYGFAVTAHAYRTFIEANDLEGPIRDALEGYDGSDDSLAKTGKAIRRLITGGEYPEELESDIRDAYRRLSKHYETRNVDIAARSSATAEDLPEASFAGQQESYLNVSGESALLTSVRKCFASLFTNRAITYREQQGFDHMEIALSVGIQKMVRSDKGAAGVMFTVDTETGFPDMVVIDGAWGLGENVVKGEVTPDEFRVFQPLLADEDSRPIVEHRLGDKQMKMIYGQGGSTRNVATSESERNAYVLSDEQILQLARWAGTIEEHYGREMDIEWALDGELDELFIVQARPETVHSQISRSAMKSYKLEERGDVLVEGIAVGGAISSGKAFVLENMDEAYKFEDGGILVATSTDPDWVPLMKRASGIVTDYGGRTSHAAIVSRELGVAAVIGTGDATEKLEDAQEVTLSCAEGNTGYVYEGLLEYSEKEVSLEDVGETKTRIMLNVADPEGALRWWKLPHRGIGLARMEFIIDHKIKVHPMALARFDDLEDDKARQHIRQLTRGFDDKTEYFVHHLSEAIGLIGASVYPEPVIVRMSDFKTNEYADLIGGKEFEPHEENPMLGFRGASRYYSERYEEGFGMECRAIARARDVLGLDNVIVMIPFCRTVDEADRVLETMAKYGLERGGDDGLQVYMMAEIPSNIVLAEEFAERFDGFSIGSNDLTQLVLGIDRDSTELSDLFDERNEAVKRMIADLIERAHAVGKPVGICGQAPSDHPDFAEFLVEAGIDSMSLNPDSVLEVHKRVRQKEIEMGEQ